MFAIQSAQTFSLLIYTIAEHEHAVSPGANSAELQMNSGWKGKGKSVQGKKHVPTYITLSAKIPKIPA